MYFVYSGFSIVEFFGIDLPAKLDQPWPKLEPYQSGYAAEVELCADPVDLANAPTSTRNV